MAFCNMALPCVKIMFGLRASGFEVSASILKRLVPFRTNMSLRYLLCWVACGLSPIALNYYSCTERCFESILIMSVPSYMYAALSPSVESLAATLDRMGGGDARVAPMEAHCLVARPPAGTAQQQHKGDRKPAAPGAQVLWVGEGAIGVRNIDLPASAPIADCMAYHRASACHELRKKDFEFVDAMPHK